MAIQQNQIIKKYIILCEGIDVLNFMLSYLNELKNKSKSFDDIQLLNFGGITDLYKYITVLQQMENYDMVNRLLILRDAELDVMTAINSIKGALKKAGLPIPNSCNEWTNEENAMRISFTLLPNCSKEPIPGALEDLCWDILVDKIKEDMKIDVKTFISQIKNKYNSISTHEHKSRLHTLFAINEKLISMKIGEAAKSGAFNWNSKCLEPLKDLIEKGF